MLSLTGGFRRNRLEDLERRLMTAGSYPEWLAAAGEHDALSGAEVWKAGEDNAIYDAIDIRRRHDWLARAVQARDAEDLLFTLNEGIHGNMGGMGNPALYSVAKSGTKTLVENYVAAIVDALYVVAAAPENEIGFAEKLDFFHRAALCYGRSALLLSGGGGLVYFHHGVVESLLEEGLLPNVLAGSSAGAWMCAQIGTRTDAELQGYFANKRYSSETTGSIRSMALRMRSAKKDPTAGKARDEVVEGLVDDLTFAEAFEHSGRHINISIASGDQHHRARLLNAITSPNVTLRSACRASASIPQFVDPVMLEAKNRHGKTVPYLPNQRWIDGAFGDDLPIKRLARLYGVNHFVVSQINLISAIVPFIRPDPKSGREGALHDSSQLLVAALRGSAKLAKRSLGPLARKRDDSVLATAYRVLDQDYSGDITISAQFSRKSLQHMAFRYERPEEIEALIDDGRRATWPRIEQIRNASVISSALDRILARLDADAAARCHPAPRRAGTGTTRS
ncbi:MAG: patatin-like phospholipase family protein [Novosphingobium sp.]